MTSTEYVEIFHSKPSWQPAYIVRRDAASESGWATPTAADALIEAGHIREKFRVARLDLRDEPNGVLRFTITNGSERDWDGPPDNPSGWHEVSEPGLYVVEHGIRRVGDVSEECERVMRWRGDRHVEVAFVAELWERCFFAYQPEGGDWVAKPGVEMALPEGAGERKFGIAVEAPSGCQFAFNNGLEGEEEVWDSNHGQNVCSTVPDSVPVSEWGSNVTNLMFACCLFSVIFPTSSASFSTAYLSSVSVPRESTLSLRVKSIAWDVQTRMFPAVLWELGRPRRPRLRLSLPRRQRLPKRECLAFCTYLACATGLKESQLSPQLLTSSRYMAMLDTLRPSSLPGGWSSDVGRRRLIFSFPIARAREPVGCGFLLR